MRKKQAFAITWDGELESAKDESDNEAQSAQEQILVFMAASETEGQLEYPKRLVENVTDDKSSASDEEEL